jgi:NO-binding membrane sensor protein with MHYT domain
VVPLDHSGARIGEIVANLPSASLYVLSYGIAVVGCWVSLILVEQAIALRVRSTTLGVFVWLLISSFAATIGVWSSTIIGITAINIPDLPSENNVITYDLLLNLVSFFPTWVLMFIAFWATICGVHSRSTAAVRIENGIETLNSLQTKNDSPQQQTSPVSTGTPSDISLSIPGQTRNKLSRSEKCRKFWSKITDRSLVIGTLFLVAAIVITNVTSTLSVRSPCTSTWIGGVIGGAYLTCGVTGYLALLLLFHLRTTQYRSIGAFVFAASVSSCHFIMQSGVDYEYHALVPAPGVSGTTLQLVGSIVTAVISFILIGLNVTKLKLSRDILDSYLLATQKKARALEVIIQQRDDQIEEHGILFKLINVMRPITRKNHFTLQGLLNAADAHQALYGANEAVVPVLSSSTTPPAVRSVYSPPRSGSPKLALGQLGPASMATGKTNPLLIHHGVPVGATAALAVLQAAGVPILQTATCEQLNKEAMSMIMENVATLEVFKDTVHDNHNSESLAFWIDVQTYKRTKTIEERRVAANDIVAMFLEEAAPHSVNISGALRTQILKKVRESKESISRTIFESAELEVRRLLQSNDWSRFIGSEQYDACLLILKATRHLKQKKLDNIMTGNKYSAHGDTGDYEDGSSDPPQPPTTISPKVTERFLPPRISSNRGSPANSDIANEVHMAAPHPNDQTVLLPGAIESTSPNGGANYIYDGVDSPMSSGMTSPSPNSIRGKPLIAVNGVGTPKSASSRATAVAAHAAAATAVAGGLDRQQSNRLGLPLSSTASATTSPLPLHLPFQPLTN